MRETQRFFMVLLLLVTSVGLPSTACKGGDRAGYTIEWVGELGLVLREGDARPRIHLREIEPGDGTFALGPLAGLRGEITVIDGNAYIARADEGGASIERGFDHEAPFLVLGRVGVWHALPVPETVGEIGGLERWLRGVAAKHGLEPDKPFPFKIETSTSTLGYHVISNTEPGFQVARPHRELMRWFTIESEPVQILGVYSEAHGGVFTHHGQATHLHMVSGDELRSGHVDKLDLGSGSVAYLPLPSR